MSIKYSEIFAADEVLSAGTDDIIVLAIVDGLSPTGFTSKAIKAGNLLNWQGVMDLGSTALDIVSDAILVTDQFKVDFKSKKDEDKESRLILDYFIKTELSFRDYIAGTNLIKIDETGFLVQDELALKGAFYAADYSANFVALSLITKGYADTNLGGESLNPIFVNPTGFEDGFVPSWDDSAQEYTLVPNLNGIYSGDGTFNQDAEAALNGFELKISGIAGTSTIFDLNGNVSMDGNGTRFTVGVSAVDQFLPDGGVYIENDVDFGTPTRWGTITGISGSFLDVHTTFKFYSDIAKATILDFNHAGTLAGKLTTRVGGLVFDSGDFDIVGNLKIEDGTQGNIGDVWTSTDALGNGGWAAGGGGGNGIYGGSDTIVAGVETLVNIPSVSKLNFGSGDLVITGANLPGVGQGRNVGIKVGALNPLAPLQIGIGFNGSGQASLITPVTGTTAIFQNNFNVGDTARLAIVSGINGNVSIDLGDTDDIDVARIFYRNSSNQMSFYTNAVEQVLISSAGEVTVNDLSGTGTRMVVSDAAGLLSTQAVPTGVANNIYTANDTLLSPRTVTMGVNSLTFSGNDVIFAGGSTYNLGAGGVVTNTVFGNDALIANTTGSRNSAFGFQALKSTTTGIYNTAIGAYTLRDNVSGIYNTAIGTNVLISSTGNNNTVVGAYAMIALSTGSDNTSLGATTLRDNTSGSDNVALGSRVMEANTTGGENVAVGKLSLFANTTGLRNVALGNTSGRYYVGSDKLFIDNQQRTNAATELTNSLIVGDFSATVANQRLRFNANVGIGSDASISQKLRVVGGDVLVEGATDLNLLNIASATNQFAIGSVPFAGVKASIVNTEAQAYSLLVLNQSTTAEFGVMETGVVYTNSKIAIAVGTAPTSSSKLIVGGDIEVISSGYHYFGDPTTDGTWRQYNDGSNFVSQRRELGVWVTKQTILA